MITYNIITKEEKINIINGFIDSKQNLINFYQNRLDNYKDLDASSKAGRLNEEGLSYEISRLSNIVSILNAYKETIN